MGDKNLTSIPESLRTPKEITMISFVDELNRYQTIGLNDKPLPDWL